MNTTKQLTRSAARMHTQIDWLDGYHSFCSVITTILNGWASVRCEW